MKLPDAHSPNLRRPKLLLHESRSLSRCFREDGSGLLTVELPRAQLTQKELELVLQALGFVCSTLPDDPSRSLFAKAADALVHEGSFSIQRHHNGRYYFVRPDGRPVELPASSSAEDRVRPDAAVT